LGTNTQAASPALPPLKDERTTTRKAAWGALVMCVILHMGLPLAPLAIEYLVTGHFTPESLSISAVMYCATLGVSSRWRVVLATVIAILIFFAPLYGIALSHNEMFPTPPPHKTDIRMEQLVHHDLGLYSGLLIVGIFVLHLIERVNRHVIQHEPFWNFS
jgi:hypothetical protein